MTQPAPKATRTDLLQCALGPIPAGGRLELRAYISELDAGYEGQAHRHAYPTVAYVLAGRFRLEVGEGPGQVREYGPGGVFSEPAGEVVRGSALEPTRLLVVVAKEPGAAEARPAA